MVQTRRSLSKSPATSTKETNNKPETPRSRRRQTRDVLRSQSTGVGISIDTTSSDTQSKKIVFDEEGNAPRQEQENTVVAAAQLVPEESKGTATSDDDDDDDAIEEVKGSDAKSQIQEQRTIERSTARESTAIRGGQKRKRKQSKTIEIISKDEIMDEDFFQQLDAEIEKSKKESSQDNKKQKKPQGKLITFLAKDEALQNRVPMKKEHNIQVVVLKDDNDVKKVQSGPPLPLVGAPPSTVYSRFHVNNGRDEPSAKQLQKMKKTGKKAEETWTRSNKVTRKLLSGGHRVNLQQPQSQGDASSKQANRTIVIRL